MLSFRRYIAVVILSVTALWATPALADEFRWLSDTYYAVAGIADSQAPPVMAEKMPANAASLYRYEKTNGDLRRAGVKTGAAQVDAQIVGAERAQKSWRHAGINTL